jgi:hypothetical protein
MSRSIRTHLPGKLCRLSISSRLRNYLFLALIVCATTFEAKASAPELVSEATSTRAIALESVSLRCEPFPLTQANKFGTDDRTRIILFARNVDLLSGETASAVTAEAEDATHARYALAVEYVGPVLGFNWLSQVVVRLNDNLGDVGDDELSTLKSLTGSDFEVVQMGAIQTQ